MQTNALHTSIRRERLKRHLTQKEVAEHLGVSQAAVSYYEGGNPGALSNDKVEKLLALLKMASPIDEVRVAPDQTMTAGMPVLAWCPCEDCLLGSPEVVNGNFVVRPAMFQVSEGIDQNHCPACGTELKCGCDGCLTDLRPGALFCTGCGRPLVTISPSLKDEDPEEHANRMRERAQRHRALSISIETLPRPELRRNGRRARVAPNSP